VELREFVNFNYPRARHVAAASNLAVHLVVCQAVSRLFQCSIDVIYVNNGELSILSANILISSRHVMSLSEGTLAKLTFRLGARGGRARGLSDYLPFSVMSLMSHLGGS